MVLRHDLDRCRNRCGLIEHGRQVIGVGIPGGGRLGGQQGAERGAARTVLDLPAKGGDPIAEGIGAVPVACRACFGPLVEQAPDLRRSTIVTIHRQKYSCAGSNVPGGPRAPQPYYPITSRTHRTCPVRAAGRECPNKRNQYHQ